MEPAAQTRFLQRFLQRLHERVSESEHVRGEHARDVEIAIARARLGDPPRDLNRLAQSLGVVDIQDLPLAMNGRLMRAPNGGWTIELNEKIDPGIRPFIFAHELAHLILDAPRPNVRRVDSDEMAYEASERKYDEAALEILMPMQWLINNVQPTQPLLSEAVRVAAALDLSVELAATALAATQIWDGQLTSWRRGEHEWQPDARNVAFKPLPDESVSSGNAFGDLAIGKIAFAKLQLESQSGDRSYYRAEMTRIDADHLLVLLNLS